MVDKASKHLYKFLICQEFNNQFNMAYLLARVFGTEEDKVNCSFFFKIGACRHGEKCTRLHYKPP